ncbi:MAG: dTDP-4-dehydrorhamnose reductase [Myxococcota bacterium]
MSGGDDIRVSANALRIGVLGAAGQLGRCLVRAITADEDLALVFATKRDQLDLAKLDEIGPWLDSLGDNLPELVINAAAYTKVDTCESEQELAHRVNALAPVECARALLARDIRFIHLSTDYVFPGDGSRPYREEDETSPKTVYGSTKRAGEIGVLEIDPSALVVRTSWVFGPGRNFVIAILDQAARRRSGELDGPLKVVSDQRGAPTSAADLAEALLSVGRQGRSSADQRSGLLHLRNAGETTWYGFARAILDGAGYTELEIEPVATSTFPTTAPRPLYSLLSCERAEKFGIRLRSWNEALAAYLAGPDVPSQLLSKVGSQDAVAAGQKTSPPRHPEIPR